MRETEFDELLARSSLGRPAARRAREQARLADLAAVYNRLVEDLDNHAAATGRQVEGLEHLTGSYVRSTCIRRLDDVDLVPLQDEDQEHFDVDTQWNFAEGVATVLDAPEAQRPIDPDVAEKIAVAVAARVAQAADDAEREAGCGHGDLHQRNILILCEGQTVAPARMTLIDIGTTSTRTSCHTNSRELMRRLWANLYQAAEGSDTDAYLPHVKVVDACPRARLLRASISARPARDPGSSPAASGS